MTFVSDTSNTYPHGSDETAGRVSLGITLNVVVAGNAVYSAELARSL